MTPIEQMTESQKTAIESAFVTSQQLFARGETLLALNVATAKHAMSAIAGHAYETLSAKDPQGFVNMQVAAVQPLGEKAVAYGKEVLSITQAAAADLSKAIEATTAGAQERTTEWFETASKPHELVCARCCYQSSRCL
jgi:phasin family protein